VLFHAASVLRLSPPGLKKIVVIAACFVSTAFTRAICSHEHENLISSSLGLCIAQADRETEADGIGFMDPTLKTLKAALEAIREVAMNALNHIEQSQDQRSMRWKCKQCRYIKHFTTPVP
jgi:hypothetical protein